MPQSPEANVFDRGIWKSLQSAVEKYHLMLQMRRHFVTNEETFLKVFHRLKETYEWWSGSRAKDKKKMRRAF